VNRFDVSLRQTGSRKSLPLPWTLGVEFAGEVEGLGSGAAELAEGQRVWVLHELTCLRCQYCLAGKDNLCERPQMWGVDRPGGYAEYVVAPAWAVLPLADSVSFEIAAASQAAWVTAWHMLTTRARVRPGETVLVSAAAGGVGLAAVQVAKLAGARVIATAGSAEKRAFARDEGADETLDHYREDVTERVLELTGGRGVDVVIENVGGELFSACMGALKKDGRLVFCGSHGGAVVPLDLLPAFRAEWQLLGARTGTTQEHCTVMDLVAEGKLRPKIHEVVPLEDASEAHRILEESEQLGRVVLAC
jgi:NADPH:quinone reductase-like Zn-dependent oxidoreductase